MGSTGSVLIGMTHERFPTEFGKGVNFKLQKECCNDLNSVIIEQIP